MQTGELLFDEDARFARGWERQDGRFRFAVGTKALPPRQFEIKAVAENFDHGCRGSTGPSMQTFGTQTQDASRIPFYWLSRAVAGLGAFFSSYEATFLKLKAHASGQGLLAPSSPP
jgi:hypothetical protein